MDIFDYMGVENYKVKKPLRVIGLFSGYGSPELALKELGFNYENYKISEWQSNAILSYNKLHKNTTPNYSENLSKEDIENYFIKFVLSVDGKKPLTEKQIRKISEKNIRLLYNATINTGNLGSITSIKGCDLQIIDKDKYEYLMTYSFPCQDLSLVGNKKGMVKGSGTRSGLLWEVERLLDELGDNLPQLLLMENVPQVKGGKNKADFDRWQNYLARLGYKNFVMELNAKDYGIPQGRKRVYMLSILNTTLEYQFPKPIKLDKNWYEYSETSVDESYYLSVKNIKTFLDYDKKFDRKKIFLNNIRRMDISQTITTKLDRAESQYVKKLVIIDIKANPNYSANPSHTIAPTQYAQEHYGVISHEKVENESEINLVKEYPIDGVALVEINGKAYIKENDDFYRIRRMTPLEAFRLMGVKDEDFYKLKEVNSNSSLYKLAGNSIVVDVLVEIFRGLL